MKKTKTILVLGGARSGKSSFAYKLAKSFGSRIVYVATAQPLGKEMAERIRKHKKDRPKGIRTIEEPRSLLRIKQQIPKNTNAVLFECLTLYTSNVFKNTAGEKKILKDLRGFAEALKKRKVNTIFVSNELGLGIVPNNRLSRGFRDTHGRVNQLVAKLSDEVYLLVAGIPVKVK